MGQLKGTLVYHSPLFITQKSGNNKLILHGGTLFDYVFTIDKSLNGQERKKFIILGYLRGLLSLINAYETGIMTDQSLKGTSYIINERTATKIGFKKVPVDGVQYIILAFNYFTLMAAYSVANAKLSFPKLSEVKTFEASLSELAERKGFIKDLEKFLSNSLSKKL
ncbi:hypothetical protein E1176_03995 [Fulvivirga sp. RKSG066]|nr:hypothetical protein [Fulvivirga aurantia]